MLIEENARIFLRREVESEGNGDAFGNLERDGGELSKGDAVGGEMGLGRAEENAVMAAIAEDECSLLVFGVCVSVGKGEGSGREGDSFETMEEER